MHRYFISTLFEKIFFSIYEIFYHLWANLHRFQKNMKAVCEKNSSRLNLQIFKNLK